ncbi:MAG: hypothetical protein OEU36_17960 [Gammaproteobacteria bacterium]|nr:hypothetical protein [Gammaproteobacteria bacterium]
MLSLQDCIAMADIPDDKLLELAKREHLPVMLAVALAAQRGSDLVQQGSDGIRVPQRGKVDHEHRAHRTSPAPK